MSLSPHLRSHWLQSAAGALILLCFALGIKPALAADPFAPAQPLDALEQPDFLPVTEAYEPLPGLDGNALRILWHIADGYYLYKERFQVGLRIGNREHTVTPRFEEGILKDDPFFGETIVYYGSTEVIVPELPADAVIQLKLTAQGCADAGLCYPPHDWYFSIDTATGAIAPASAPATPRAAGADRAAGSTSLWLTLLLAALGGSILNLMPCVFPVLGLKVLSFANAHHGRPVTHGALYSAGVLVSFAAVAALLIALQDAGRAIGWGFQLQSPLFVAALSWLFFLLSLNLLGVFEIAFPWLNAGSALAGNQGRSGSFFTGVLATIVASPCTAPFMGTAVGFAATQPAAVALLVFLAIGAGMALPVFILTLFPGWLRWLPRPGAWMVRLRQFLAFPLLASALWLVWVIGRQTGANGMAATLVSWLLLGFALWLWQLGRTGKALAAGAVLAALLSLSGTALAPNPTRESSGTVAYSAQALEQLRRDNVPVFVDATADWCITCKANEALVLSRDSVQRAFRDKGIVYMVADWTLYDPEITRLLDRYQRNGIPLYLLYPADSSQPALVLPQILTRELVLDAIDRL